MKGIDAQGAVCSGGVEHVLARRRGADPCGPAREGQAAVPLAAAHATLAQWRALAPPNSFDYCGEYSCQYV